MNRLKSALTGFAVATFVSAGTLVCTQVLLPGLSGPNGSQAAGVHAAPVKADALRWTGKPHLKLW
ncbi:MAG TPA: hypothetical protein VMJ73_06060 [Rhizomicrobium sp.]|nr:hypothetical protein [Rhizomicrobium sp.]